MTKQEKEQFDAKCQAIGNVLYKITKNLLLLASGTGIAMVFTSVCQDFNDRKYQASVKRNNNK